MNDHPCFAPCTLWVKRAPITDWLTSSLGPLSCTTTKHTTSPFSNILPRQAHMQRSRWETSFVSNLTACNTKTRWPLPTPDDRSVHHSATPSASRRLSRRWSRILFDRHPLTTDHPPGWLSQWLIYFPGPRVPLRTVHMAILCWRHRLPMTDQIKYKFIY